MKLISSSGRESDQERLCLEERKQDTVAATINPSFTRPLPPASDPHQPDRQRNTVPGTRCCCVLGIPIPFCLSFVFLKRDLREPEPARFPRCHLHHLSFSYSVWPSYLSVYMCLCVMSLCMSTFLCVCLLRAVCVSFQVFLALPFALSLFAASSPVLFPQSRLFPRVIFLLLSSLLQHNSLYAHIKQCFTRVASHVS